MTVTEFKFAWIEMEYPLDPIDPSRLENLNLRDETKLFLSTAGLPNFAEPNLAFAQNIDDPFKGIAKLSDSFDCSDPGNRCDQLIVIGDGHTGNCIAIDTGKNDSIWEIDQENNFSERFFNTSLSHLAGCLVVYQQFEEMVMNNKDSSQPLLVYKFSDEQFQWVKTNLAQVDPPVMETDSFWKLQLETLLSLRKKKAWITNDLAGLQLSDLSMN